MTTTTTNQIMGILEGLPDKALIEILLHIWLILDKDGRLSKDKRALIPVLEAALQD